MQRDYIREYLACIPTHVRVLNNEQRKRIRGALIGRADDDALLLIDWYVYGYRHATERKAALPNERDALKRIKQAAKQYAAAMQEAGPCVYGLDDAANQTPLFRDRYLGMEIKKSAEWAGYVAEFAAKAETEVRPGRRQPNRCLRLMIWNLWPVWEQVTGKRFQRDGKRGGCRDFIEAVARIADPKIGNGEIDQAMKWALGERRRQNALMKNREAEENEPEAYGEIQALNER